MCLSASLPLSTLTSTSKSLPTPIRSARSCFSHNLSYLNQASSHLIPSLQHAFNHPTPSPSSIMVAWTTEAEHQVCPNSHPSQSKPHHLFNTNTPYSSSYSPSNKHPSSPSTQIKSSRNGQAPTNPQSAQSAIASTCSVESLVGTV